jgi:hydrogenase maturation protease
MKQFESEVARSLKWCANRRVAVLGIGNEFRHDDGVGLAVIDSLKARIDDPFIVMLNCADAPENFTGYVKRFTPSCIILVDAADFGGHPGEAHIFALSDLQAADVTTHKASLAVLGAYLGSETGASVFVVGIQPVNTDFGNGLSPILRAASNSVAEAISAALNRFTIKRA